MRYSQLTSLPLSLPYCIELRIPFCSISLFILRAAWFLVGGMRSVSARLGFHILAERRDLDQSQCRISECVIFVRQQRKEGKRVGHPVNATRELNGEFHHLYKDLRNDESRFFSYLRYVEFHSTVSAEWSIFITDMPNFIRQPLPCNVAMLNILTIKICWKTNHVSQLLMVQLWDCSKGYFLWIQILH